MEVMKGLLLKTVLGVLAAVTSVQFLMLPVTVQAAYSNTNVIADSVYLDKNSMNEAAINGFLASNGSWLTNYVIPRFANVPYPVGKGQVEYIEVEQVGPSGEAFYNRTAANLIYAKAQQFGINPRVLLATLQKESTAITRSSPSSELTAQWPMFYAFHDGMRNCYNLGISCNSSAYRQQAIDYGGVGQQLAYSMYFFKINYDRYLNTFADPIEIPPGSGVWISCETVGTRVLYRYTPTFSGQQSFYNIFAGWWGPPNQGIAGGFNDTTDSSFRTYRSSIVLSGNRHTDSSVKVNGQTAATNGTKWQITVNLPLGNSVFNVEYRNSSGTIIGTKKITVWRHKLSDINNDGRIDILDLSIFAESYGQDSQTADPMSDLNEDGKVNILDLSIFAENYAR